MILYSEGATQAQEDEAQSILGALCDAYPGHPWAVRVYEGGFFIRYLDPRLQGNYGMNCKGKNFDWSASAMKREIIMMAGEWLERAGLVRGRWNEDETQHVEGIPDKYQPTRPAIVLHETAEQNPNARLIVPQEHVTL